MFLALVITVLLLFTEVDGPWLTLTVRGLAIAFVFAFLFTPCRRWIVSGCLAASILLSTPSFFGEQFSVPAAGLALVASILSVFSRLGGETREARDSKALALAITPLLLLSAYWAILTMTAVLDQRAEIILGYFLISVAVTIVFMGDREAIRETLMLLALFVAALGYSWLLTTAFYAVFGLDPTIVPSSAYELRQNFGYQTWGPLLITNSQGPFGLPRVADIGGEPGTWALYGGLGAASAGVVFADRPVLRRLTLAGGLIAIISSQSTGALVSLVGGSTAALIVAAGRKRAESGSRHRVPASFVLAALLALGVPVLLRNLVDIKISQNDTALTDRGLGFLGAGGGGGAESRINLISALATDGVATLLPMIGLVLLVVALRRNSYTFALSVYILLMGLLVQPVQTHVAVWFACALLTIIVARSKSVIRFQEGRDTLQKVQPRDPPSASSPKSPFRTPRAPTYLA